MHNIARKIAKWPRWCGCSGARFNTRAKNFCSQEGGESSVGLVKFPHPSYLEPVSGFSPEKAVQLCALFLLRAKGPLDKLKLIKLLYLSDRRFFSLYGEPILWDEYYSLPHGPICSAALNCIDKNIANDISDAFFQKSGDHGLRIVLGVNRDHLDYLCEAEIEVVDEVWLEHGRKTASQLRNYTHTHCPEYTLIEHGRIRIAYESILAAVGHDRPRETADEIESYRGVIAKYT